MHVTDDKFVFDDEDDENLAYRDWQRDGQCSLNSEHVFVTSDLLEVSYGENDDNLSKGIGTEYHVQACHCRRTM